MKPGNRPAAHCSAQGRIVLAFADEAVRDRQLRRKLTAFTPQSIAEPDAVRRRLAAVRERLYEDAPNEVLTGINALAAPILRDGDALVGMIGIVGSIQDIPSPALPQQGERQGHDHQAEPDHQQGHGRSLGVIPPAVGGFHL